MKSFTLALLCTAAMAIQPVAAAAQQRVPPPPPLSPIDVWNGVTPPNNNVPAPTPNDPPNDTENEWMPTDSRPPAPTPTPPGARPPGAMPTATPERPSLSQMLDCPEEENVSALTPPGGTNPAPATNPDGTAPTPDEITSALNPPGGTPGTGTGTGGTGGGGTGTGTGTGTGAGGTGTGAGTGGVPAGSRGTGAAGMPTGSAASCNRGVSMARADRASINRALAARATLQAAAQRHGIDWRLLAAVGVRETGFRAIDNPNPNDPGWGVFQLTRVPGVSHAQAHNLAFAANRAAQMLKSNIDYLRRRFPRFTQAQLLQAAAASYNFGTDDISGNPNTIDVGTTGNNYGQNILLLMNCFS